MRFATKPTVEEQEAVELTAALYALVTYLHASCHQDLLDAIDREQLTFPQLRLLERLRHGARAPTIRQAAPAMGLSIGAASRSIAELARRGLVRREGDERDERAKRVVLTDRGATVIPRLHAARLDTAAAAVESLADDERQRLYAAIEPLRERTAAYRPPPDD